MKSNYVCALDLGSSKIAACLARLNKKNKVCGILFESIATRGIKKGRIADIQEVSNCIEQLLKSVSKSAGINIRSVYINIYGTDIITRHSHAIIPLAERSNKVITHSDIRKVIQEARVLGCKIEEDVLRDMPLGYVIDEQGEISNPLGLYGHKLEVELLLILVKISYLQSIHRLFNRLGFEIKNLFLSGLATSKISINRDLLKNGIYAFCDMGSDITEITIFENGVLKSIETLFIGGNDLTQAIANAFKIPFELAEDIKKSYACIVDPVDLENDRDVMIKSDGLYKSISQKKICEVVSSVSNELFGRIKERLDVVMTQDKIINSLFVSGRAVLTDGFLEKMEGVCGCSVRMVSNRNLVFLPKPGLDAITSTPQFLTYATSLGILQEALELLQKKYLPFPKFTGSLIQKAINSVKEIYQEYF